MSQPLNASAGGIAFHFTEEQEMIRSMVREFVEKEVKPLAAQVDRERKIPPSILNRAKELGLFGVAFPEEYGGAGAGEIGYCVMMEEMAHGCSSLTAMIAAHEGIGAMSIYLAGTEEQKRKYLPSLAGGEKIACYALTEPGGGSDAAMMRTTAVKKGDRYILNGDKIWITNADVADVFIVYAVTDAALRAHGGITCFILERGMRGMTIGPLDEKMGLRGLHSPPLFFDNVEVPEENVLGKVGEGFRYAMMALDRGRMSVASGAIGAGKEVLDLSIAHAKQRQAFGKPIVEHEMIQGYLAQMAAWIFAMESMVYRTAWLCDTGQKFSRESAMAKWMCSEWGGHIVDLAIQIHGGMGYMSEMPFERFYRDSRLNRIWEGTSEIQQIVIARDLAKKGRY